MFYQLFPPHSWKYFCFFNVFVLQFTHQAHIYNHHYSTVSELPVQDCYLLKWMSLNQSMSFVTADRYPGCFALPFADYDYDYYDYD